MHRHNFIKFACILFMLLLATSVQGLNGRQVDELDPNIRQHFEDLARFIEAFQKNDIAAVETLLNKGISPDTIVPTRTPALMKALIMNNMPMFKLLLSHGANLENPDHGGNTPLLCAAGLWRENLVSFLLDQGADIKATNDAGCTALIMATYYPSPSIANLLLKRGAAIDAQTHKGETSLMIAARTGEVKMVRCLLEHHANYFLRDNKHHTAQILASENHHSDIVKILAALPTKFKRKTPN